MAPESTPTAANPAAPAPVASGQTVAVPTPAAGASVTVDSSPAGHLKLGFDPSTATVTRTDNSLEFKVDGGGTVVVKDFFAVGNQSLPDLTLPDGTVVASTDFFAGSGLNMTTAAGPAGGGQAPGGGGTNYVDDAGNLLGGIDRLGSLGTDQWDGGSEVPDIMQGRTAPGGSFAFTSGTDLGGAFQATVYEDGMPDQHVGDYTLHAGRINIALTPDAGSTVGNITLSNFPEGTQIFIGDPATGGVAQVPGVGGFYTFTEADFLTTGVYIIPPTNSDNDISVNATVEFRAGGTSTTISGSFTIIVDAVADLPVNVDGVLVDDGNAGHGMSGTVTKSEGSARGFEETEYTVTAKAGEATVEVKLNVTATFADYVDGSEQHYALVEQLPGFTGNYSTVQVNGVTYFQIPVSNATIAAGNGTVTIPVTLHTPQTTADTTFSARTGAMAVETPSDGELRLDNNVATNFDQTPVNFTVDVIDSTLTITAGWASEGNAPGKHDAAPYAPNYAGMGVDNNSTQADGAPISLSLGGTQGSTETITSVTFTYDESRGTLFFNGVPVASGTVLDVSASNSGTVNGLVFQPATTGDQQYNDDDVNLNYSVVVKNAEGATGTFTGTSTVVIDAVADRPGDVTSTVDDDVITSQAGTVNTSGDAAAPNLVTGLETDTFTTNYTATTYPVEVTVNTTFAPDSSESHYVLIEKPADINGQPWTVGTLPAGLVDTGTTYTGSDGKTYFKLEVTDPLQTSVNAPITLNTPPVQGDMPVTDIKTGALAVENAGSTRAGAEYDTANNSSEVLDNTPVSVTVDVVNSGLQVTTGWASESNNDAKHLGQPSSAYAYPGTQAGATGDAGAPITLSLTGATSGSTESISTVTFTFDDARGSLWYNGTEYHSGQAIAINAANSSGLVFKPASTSFDQSDVKLDYTVNVTNVAGASASFTGSSTVVIDAVADKPTIDSLTADDVTYHANNGVEQQAAKPGETVELKSTVTFPDTTAEGAESHFILIKAGAGVVYESVTVGGTTYTAAQIAGFPVVNGYHEIPVDRSLGSVDVSIKVHAGDSDRALNTVTTDKTFAVEIGGKATVAGSDLEYDTANNTSTTTKALNFDVSPANSAGKVVDVDTYESTDGTAAGINPNKHGTEGHTTKETTTPSGWAHDNSTTQTYGSVSVAANLGDVTFSLTSPDASVENIGKVTFTIDGELDKLGTLTLNSAALSSGCTMTAVYDPGTGKTIVTITDPSPSASSVTVKFVPAAFSDADLKITDYKIDFVNPRSFDTGNTGTQPGTTVVVDAVAAKPTNLNTVIDYDGDQTAAKLGEAITIKTTVTIADTGDGNETHSVLLWNNLDSAGDSYTKVTVTNSLGQSIDLTLPGAHFILDGNGYYKVNLPSGFSLGNGTLSIDITMNAPSTIDPSKLDANGQAQLDYRIGVMSLDPSSDGTEVTTANNAAFVTKNGKFTIDTVSTPDNTFKSEGGQAYEDDRPLNNQSVNTNPADDATDDSNTALAGGVKIAITGTPHTGEYVSEVRITIQEPDGSGWRADGTRGYIEYNGVRYNAGADGVVKIPFAKTDTPFDGSKVTFVPTGHESGKVNLDVKIDVTDGQSYATKTFDGGDAEVNVDAVATRSGAIETTTDYLDHGYTAAAGLTEINIKISTSFADVDGSEDHFVLVEKQLGWGNPQGYTESWYDLDGDGTKELYYKVPVDDTKLDANGKITVDVKLTSPAGDGNYTLKTGTLVEERNIDPNTEDRTLDNNVAMRQGPDQSVTVDNVNSLAYVSDGKVYENDMAKNNEGTSTDPNTPNTDASHGTELVITAPTSAGDHIYGDVTLSVNVADIARGTFTYGGHTLTFDASGKATFTYDPAAKLIFVPAADHLDNDIPVNISGQVRNDNSGHTVPFNNGATITVDAVATLPVLLNTPADAVDFDYGAGHTKVNLGGTFTAENIKIAFEDFDNSEQHFMLIEAKAGFAIDGKTDWQIQFVDGKQYYAIPLDGPGAIDASHVSWNNGVATINLDITVPGRAYAEISDLKYGGMAVDHNSDSGEITYHNNTAVNNGGTLDFEVDYGSGGRIWVAPVYENDTPNAHLGDDTKAGGGIITFTDADKITSVTLTWDPTMGSINGNTTGSITVPGPIAPGSLKFTPADGSSDADVPLGYNINYQDRTNSTGNFDIWVDAVAQQPDEVVGHTAYDSGRTALQNGDSFTVKVDVNFGTDVDKDGSEQHYALVEAKPGWTCSNGEMVYMDGKAYFRVPVDISAIDASGLATVDVMMTAPTLTPGQTSGGVFTETFGIGAMTVDKASDGEITNDNNTSVKFGQGADATVEVKMSIVDSNISVSVGSGYEDDFKGYDASGNVIAGGGVPVTVYGLAGSDSITSMTFTYNSTAGTLYYDGNPVTSGTAIAGFDPNKTLSFTPADNHSGKDIGLNWSCHVEDSASGDPKDFGGGNTIILDSVAHKPTVDGVVVDYPNGNAAQLGDTVGVTATVTFVQAEGETPYILVEAVTGWKLAGSENYPLVYPTGNPSGGTFYRIPVDPSEIHDNGDGTFTVTKHLDVTAPDASKTDEVPPLRVGGMTEDSYSDGETDLHNNRAADLTALDLKIGVVETTNIRFIIADRVVEDDPNGSVITLNSTDQTALTTNHEIVTNTTLYFQMKDVLVVGDIGKQVGTIIYDGKAYSIDAWRSTGTSELEGRVNINFGPNGFDPAKDFRIVWGTVATDASGNVLYEADGVTPHVTDFNHTVKDVGFNTQATIVDTGSGAHETEFFNYGGGAGVKFSSVADTPESVSETHTEIANSHMVKVTLNASFDDVDGSEKHYFLIQVPSGVSAQGSYVAATAAEMAGAGVSGTGWIKVPVDGNAASVAKDVTFSVDAGYDGTATPLKYVAVSEETSNYAPGKQFAASTIEDVALPTPNTAPTGGHSVDVATEIDSSHAATVNGTLAMSTLFTDSEGDTFTLSRVGYTDVHGVLQTLNIPASGSSTVETEHGHLTIDANGAYTYEAKQDAAGQDRFSFTAKDAYGAESAATSTVAFTGIGDHNQGPVGHADSAHMDVAAATPALSGHMDLQTVFTDPEHDTIAAITHVGFNGTSIAVDQATGTDIAGDHGTLHINANGSYSYSMHAGSVDAGATDVFTFTGKDVLNTESSTDATLTINFDKHYDVLGGGNTSFTVTDSSGHAIYGSAGDNEITGGDHGDIIHAGAGNDIIHGGIGNDLIFGGTGNDTLYGGDGNDTFAWKADHLDGGTDHIMDFNLGTGGHQGDVIGFADIFGETGTCGQSAIDAMLRDGSYDGATKTFTALDTISGNSLEATFTDESTLHLTLKNGADSLQTIEVTAGNGSFVQDITALNETQAQHILEQMIKDYNC